MNKQFMYVNGTIVISDENGMKPAIPYVDHIEYRLIIDNKLKDVKFKSYCYPDKFIEHGSVNELEDKYGFNNNEIVEYIKNSLK